jgi:monofunctional biosynthetic peptidoglycan transglycosylase
MPVAQTLFDFYSADAAEHWRIINDTVMGGVSTSAFVATGDGAAFRGTVSLEHGGGFASVRAPEDDYDLSGAAGIRLVARGDGKRYNLTLYTQAGGRISYRVPFQPGDDWTTIDLPFEALTPYRRGRHVPDAPPFAPSGVRTLGFLIGDTQDGPFRLDLRSIAAAANLES